MPYASRATVKTELLGNYRVGEKLVDQYLDSDRYKGLVELGQRMGSMAYYVADQIATQESLEYTGILDDEREAAGADEEDD